MNETTSTSRRYLLPLLRTATIGAAGVLLISLLVAPADFLGGQVAEAAMQEAEAAVQQAPDTSQETAEQNQEPEAGELAGVGSEERPGAVHITGEKPIFRGLANDLFAWAWMPEVAGTVEDNTFMGGQRVKVQDGATIGGDLFIFAQTGTVSGQVAGDVYCFCQELTITSEGSVGGRVESSSEMLTIEGFAEGPIKFSGGILTINGTLRRGGSATTGSVEIGPGAQIDGVLEYESSRQASVDPAAEITGELRQIVPAVVESEEGEGADDSGWFSLSTVIWKLWHFASSFLVGALLLAAGGAATRLPAARLAHRPAHGLGFGFVIFIVMPIGAIIAMVVVIGIPLGVLTLLLFMVALYLARLVTAQAVGGLILRRFGNGAEPSAYAALAVGLVVYFVLVAIPYLGFLLWLGAIFAGLGAIYMALRAQPDEAQVEVAPAA